MSRNLPDLLKPLIALAISRQLACGFDVNDPKLAVGRTEGRLAFSNRWGGPGHFIRQPCQGERVITQTGPFAGRKRCGQLLARGSDGIGEFLRCQPVGELLKNGRRLIEPDIGQQLTDLAGMLQPGRLPRHAGHQIRVFAQPLSKRSRRTFGLLWLRSAQRDDQLARIGEILLIKLQPLDHWKIGRKQIEDFHVESQARQANYNRHEQYQPEPASRASHD